MGKYGVFGDFDCIRFIRPRLSVTVGLILWGRHVFTGGVPGYE